MGDTTYGPFVRLWGVHPSQTPDLGANPEQLKPLLTSILSEAVSFINSLPQKYVPQASPFSPSDKSSSTLSSSPWRPKDIHTFPHSISPVQTYGRTVNALDLKAVIKEHNPPELSSDKINAENWALRRSVHEDVPAEGTACWTEFVKYIKQEHAAAEKEYTPNVLETKVDNEWDCSGMEIEFDGSVWTDWTLKRESSTHKLPPPLKKRNFPVLQATAMANGRRDFIVVQIATRQASAEQKQTSTVRGAYTSIERVRQVDDGLEWVMGTASDAKGVVPGWIQKLAVPSQIAKDVDMFLGWLGKEREKKVEGAHSNGKEANGGGL